MKAQDMTSKILCKPPPLTFQSPLCHSTSKISAQIYKQNKYPVRDVRGTSPMTARQHPGENEKFRNQAGSPEKAEEERYGSVIGAYCKDQGEDK